MTHICVSKLAIIGSDNGLSPDRRQAIIWTNAGISLIGPLETNFSEILIKIHTLSFKKIDLKMSSGNRRPFCLGLNVLTLLVLKLDYSDRNNSMPWLLVLWLLPSPGQQQSWFWSYRKDFNFLRLISAHKLSVSSVYIVWYFKQKYLRRKTVCTFEPVTNRFVRLHVSNSVVKLTEVWAVVVENIKKIVIAL